MTRAAAVVPVRQRTPEWLAARRTHLGSSDAPVLVGERGSLYGLWAEKRGLVEPVFDDGTTDLMEIGTLMEPTLRALYAARTHRPIRARRVMLESREWPVASASLDAESGRRIVETKWSHSAEWFAAIEGGSTEPVPGRVYAQVQWQLYVTGREVADVAVLLGRRFEAIEIARDDRYIDEIVGIARWFWPFVESGEPPPMDGSDETTQALSRIHPRAGELWVAPDPGLVEVVRSWRQAKADLKAAEETAGTLGNTLRALIGTPNAGVAGLVSWRNNAASTHVAWDEVAEAYREVALRSAPGLADQLADALAAHTTTRPGPRVLREMKGAKAL